MTTKFKEFGLYYGYPVCCTESFLKDVTTRYFLKRPERKLQGTGFIPCESCNTKYTEEELISKINENRSKILELFKGK